jgi:hypothetical protein
MMKISLKAILLGALLATGSALYAQGATKANPGNHIDVSTLKGKVEGVTPELHPVEITVTNLTNGQKHHVTANASGGFVFENLPDGNYKVVVEAPGRRAYVVNEIKLRDEPLSILLKLGVPIRVIVR